MENNFGSGEWDVWVGSLVAVISNLRPPSASGKRRQCFPLEEFLEVLKERVSDVTGYGAQRIEIQKRKLWNRQRQ